MTWIDGTRYIVSPLNGVNGVRRNLLARIGLSVGCRVSGARGRSGSGALSLSTHNSPLANQEASLHVIALKPRVYSVEQQAYIVKEVMAVGPGCEMLRHERMLFQETPKCLVKPKGVGR